MTFARLAVDKKSRLGPMKTRLLVQVSMATDVRPHPVDTFLQRSTVSINSSTSTVMLITDYSTLDRLSKMMWKGRPISTRRPIGEKISCQKVMRIY